MYKGFCDKVKFQLCAWTTSAAVCAEGLCWKGRSAAVCAEACCCVHGFEDWRDLQLSAQIRTVVLVKSWIKCSSIDVAPTLGVNHVISCVVVLCVVSVMFFHALINIYLINKITANLITSLWIPSKGLSKTLFVYLIAKIYSECQSSVLNDYYLLKDKGTVISLFCLQKHDSAAPHSCFGWDWNLFAGCYRKGQHCGSFVGAKSMV